MFAWIATRTGVRIPSPPIFACNEVESEGRRAEALAKADHSPKIRSSQFVCNFLARVKNKASHGEARGAITVITRRTQPCEALFFTRARKLHTNCRRTDFWRGMVRFAKASARQSSFDHCEASEGRRRGELNPCLRRCPRKPDFQSGMDF